MLQIAWWRPSHLGRLGDVPWFVSSVLRHAPYTDNGETQLTQSQHGGVQGSRCYEKAVWTGARNVYKRPGSLKTIDAGWPGEEDPGWVLRTSALLLGCCVAWGQSLHFSTPTFCLLLFLLLLGLLLGAHGRGTGRGSHVAESKPLALYPETPGMPIPPTREQIRGNEGTTMATTKEERLPHTQCRVLIMTYECCYQIKQPLTINPILRGPSSLLSVPPKGKFYNRQWLLGAGKEEPTQIMPFSALRISLSLCLSYGELSQRERGVSCMQVLRHWHVKGQDQCNTLLPKALGQRVLVAKPR